MGTSTNRYGVGVEEAGAGWRVIIVDPAGASVLDRSCGTAEEARTFASTVRQHIYWLSEPKFREYYQIPDPRGA